MTFFQRQAAWLPLLLLPALAAGAERALRFAGCSVSTYAYMEEMAQAYARRHGTPVDVKGGGVPLGIAAAVAGNVDLGGSCRHLLPTEKKKGAVTTAVGYDALVFIVHPSNPVSSLTLDQVRALFSGRAARWSAVGGEDKPVVLVGREMPDAGVAVMFRAMVMKDERQKKSPLTLRNTSEIEREIETNPYGLAVSGISARGRKVKILKINGVFPDREHVRDGSYPLVRPLYLVTKGPPRGAAAHFISFVLGAEGQAVMGRRAFTLEDGRARNRTLSAREVVQ